jgi:uncharacterized membrane protein
VKTIRHYFLTGLAAVLPVSVTAFLFYIIVRELGSLFRPLLRRSVLLAPLPEWVATVMGFVFLLIIILIIGAVASGVIGRYALGWFDRLIRGIPVVRDVYGSARQLTDAVFISRRSLRKTVLAEYPSKGLYSLGFVTTDEPVFLPDGREAVWVYFPTTPNPTTGWLAIVPKGDVTETGMAIEVGLKMVISGGLLRPPDHPELIVRPARLD